MRHVRDRQIARTVIRSNSGHWIIENGFRIMKTEFEARPVFLGRKAPHKAVDFRTDMRFGSKKR